MTALHAIRGRGHVQPGQRVLVNGAAGDYFNACLVTPSDSTKRLTAPLRDLGDDPAPLN